MHAGLLQVYNQCRPSGGVQPSRTAKTAPDANASAVVGLMLPTTGAEAEAALTHPNAAPASQPALQHEQMDGAAERLPSKFAAATGATTGSGRKVPGRGLNSLPASSATRAVTPTEQPTNGVGQKRSQPIRWQQSAAPSVPDASRASSKSNKRSRTAPAKERAEELFDSVFAGDDEVCGAGLQEHGQRDADMLGSAQSPHTDAPPADLAATVLARMQRHKSKMQSRRGRSGGMLARMQRLREP